MRNAFFRAGWLLPAWLPLAQVGGRALFNVLAGVYFLWGMVALAGSHVSVQRSVLILYVLLIVAMVASAVGALDSERALKKSAEFLAHSMAFFFTLMVLQSGMSRIDALVKTYALSGAMLVIVLYLQLLYLMPDRSFEPTRMLKEDNLPFLTPMLLYFVYVSIRTVLVKYLAIIWVIAIVAVYVGISEGRAASIGLFVAVCGFMWLVLRRRGYEAALAGVFIVFIAVVAGDQDFDRHDFNDAETGGESWTERIDRFSSYRISLWQHALENRPENILLGVGIANAKYAEKAMETRHGQHMSHLHNFVLDAWYEIGAVGVTLLLALLLLLFRAGYVAYKKLALTDQGIAGVFLSSGAAILAAALLSFSYGSRQFSLYLFVILAALYGLYWQTDQRS